MFRRVFVTLALIAAGAVLLSAQLPFSDAVRGFIKVDAPVVVLANVRVIDGTGGPARANQTIVIKGGNIDAISDAGKVTPPAGATTLDLAGRSVIPGLVMVHEHLYYPAGPGVYGQLGESFIRLYLAGGVTTMRTGGNVNGFMDMKLKRAIDAGQKAGPAIDATAPYLNGANTFSQMRDLKGPDDVRRQVAYWADEGATSFKAYMQISREELRAAVDEVHKRGLKITGHLCSVTYAEAADLGIDNLEHGFMAATDFVSDKQPDVCPGQGRGQQTVAALDENGEPFKALVRKLVDRQVALTSTLTVFETLHAWATGAAGPRGVAAAAQGTVSRGARAHCAQSEIDLHDALSEGAGARARFRAGRRHAHRRYRSDRRWRRRARLCQSTAARVARRGGLQPTEAIAIGTANGARYLGRDARIGTIVVGKQADLVVLNGDPSANIADVRNVEIVFKQGVGFDPAKLLDSVRGKAGLW